MTHGWLAVLGVSIGLCLSACTGDDEEGDDGGGSGGSSGSSGSGGSGGGSGTEKLYCQVPNACDEHTIPTPALEASRDACVSEGGTVVTICPSAGLIGKCSYVSGALVIWFYEPDDAVDAESDCTSTSGTWIPA